MWELAEEGMSLLQHVSIYVYYPQQQVALFLLIYKYGHHQSPKPLATMAIVCLITKVTTQLVPQVAVYRGTKVAVYH